MNFKKTLYISIIIILILGVLFTGYYLYKKSIPTTLNALDTSFSIQIPGKINFKVKEPSSLDYKLDIYSIKDEMFINTSVYDKKYDIDMFEAVEKEILLLSDTLENVRYVSTIEELSINSFLAYKYSYVYYDNSYENDIYAEIVWIKTDKKIYILDLEVITKNIGKYKPIFNDITNSFIEL